MLFDPNVTVIINILPPEMSLTALGIAVLSSQQLLHLPPHASADDSTLSPDSKRKA